MIVGILLALTVRLCIVPPLQAAAWYDGYCKDDRGVTVVVDYQALGGGIEIRCADSFPEGGTGFDALHRAGFTTQGTNHDGDGFVCRIAGRPTVSEKIPVAKNPNYRERCIDTPPAAAYWSYWHSTNGGSWVYSNFGVKNREAIIGGFEGWSFSLNATASTNPKPRVSPKRPIVAPAPPSVPQPAAAPQSGTQITPQPGSKPSNAPAKGGMKVTSGETSGGRPTIEATDAPASLTPSPGASAGASDASAQATPTEQTVGSTISPSAGTSPAISEGPPTGTIVGLGVVVALGVVAGGVVVWRRRFG